MNYLAKFRNSSKAPRIRPLDDPEDSALPLLPLQYSDYDYPRPESGKQIDTSPPRLSRARRWWRCAAAATAGILVVVVCAIILTPRLIASSTNPSSSTNSSILARQAVDALYARQSTTLAQASARYSLRTGRPPPPYYAHWYQFAREKRCLIDEYDQIHRDFKPFYQLAGNDAASFQAMIDRATQELDGVDAEIARVEIRDGEVEMAGNTAYAAYWPDTVRKFSRQLPNMTFFMNGRDEPRIAFNYRAPGAQKNALLANDSTPFRIQPRPTIDFFAHQSGCNIPLEVTGFMSSANNDSGFLIASAKPGFTTDLYPMLSMAKISPCFSDILFPTEYYYERSWWAPHFEYGDNVPWHKKKSQICKSHWRGMSNGGMIIGNNYHHFPRFKLIDIGRQHPDLMDVAITRFAETLCEEGCDRDAVWTEYDITGVGQPREDLYGYKYVVDVDGTTFSGRFLGLLRSGSLSTLFEEYFNDWLRPFEHYVPVLPDLSDLVQKIEWANANPDEARLIQQRGLEAARRVLTDDQNDCYMFAVLVEWAQLQDYAKNDSASS
ncbi:glycosyl transferase family 90-domain-containing protein [Mycena leptocephala]|nr:glycosyl transferase family 90-domain-containing protein [Mycena leptocephala]